MADTKLLLVLLSVLAFSTIITGVIIQSYQSWNTYGNDTFTGKCPAGYGAYCPYPVDPSQSYLMQGEVNLTTTDATNVSWADVSDTGFTIPLIKYWKFNSGIGMISNTGESLTGMDFGDYDSLYIRGIQRSPDGYYRTMYWINNTVQKPFIIQLHALYKSERFRVEFADNKVGIPGTIPFTYLYRTDVPGLFINPLMNVTTEWNPSTSHVKVSLNTNIVLNETIEEPCVIPVFFCPSPSPTDYFGGVGAKNNGVTWRGYYTLAGQSVTNEQVNPETPVWNAILDIVPWGHEIKNFADTFLGIATFQYSTATDTGDWAGEPIIPWWIVVFTIYIPIIAIVAYGIQLLRGD